MDTWRAAYAGIVPDDYLANLSYGESERLWLDVIDAREGCVFVAEGDRGIYGFASGRPRRRFSKGLEEYRGVLETVYVLPAGQGTGVGRDLMEAVARYFLDHAVTSMILWVFEENHAARGFYEALGGVPVAGDGFEIGGAWVREMAYGWRDLGVLLRRAGPG